MTYPLQLTDVFLVHVHFEREPDGDSDGNFAVNADIKTFADEYPERIQVNLRLRKQEDDIPFHFEIEVVGIFKYIGENAEEDRERIAGLVSDNHVINILWAYLVPTIKSITALMGLRSMDIYPPGTIKKEKNEVDD